MEGGTFGYVLSSAGLKVKSNLRLMLGLRDILLRSGFLGRAN
jgi:hypothetical protein